MSSEPLDGQREAELNAREAARTDGEADHERGSEAETDDSA